MANEILGEPGRTFSEFSLLPDGLTTKQCKIDNISLETVLAGIKLKIPLISAAMMSVTGYDMALELGKRGGIGILPNKLTIEEQAGIVNKIKDYEMEFVNEPMVAYQEQTIANVLEEIERHGHSTIPVVDKFQNFLGMFEQEMFWEMGISVDEPVTSAMVPFNGGNTEIKYIDNPDITVAEVKDILKGAKRKYVVVTDKQQRFVKLAFKQDIETIKVGVAISTHKGWQERVLANIEAGVDLISIDSSDGYSEFQGDLIREYKSTKAFDNVPICGGNVVTLNGAKYLMEQGADIVKLGMSSGSICTTRREKGVGRATVSALLAAVEARNKFSEKRYVPLIWDGGASCAADFIIALAMGADAVMAGGYFNHFYEAAGEKYDGKGKQTNVEAKIESVATWGEGSSRAKNMDRYGQSRRTFFTEGEEGTKPYFGRMKPHLERDLNKIKAALCNAGCTTLPEFREKAVLELMSPASQGIVGNVHNMSLYKGEQ